MHKRCQELLPFYANGTLPPKERREVEEHVLKCVACRQSLAEWQHLALTVQVTVVGRSVDLPPLATRVRARLQPRPTPKQAFGIAWQLVWAQRVVILRGGIIPVVLVVLLVGLLATITGRDQIRASLPLLIVVPATAALCTAFLYGPESDPAFELVHTAPTATTTLWFARLTLVLGLSGSMAGLASALLSALGYGELFPLISAWLGPMLLLSAMATVLAILWRPAVAAGVSLTLWAAIVSLLGLELSGYPIRINLSLQPLLHPSGILFAAQMATAVLLWLLGWLLLSHDLVNGLKTETEQWAAF